jgi:hypothetical protein
MKSLRDYIDLIEAAEIDPFKPTKSNIWKTSKMSGSTNNEPGASTQIVKYDQNTAGEHRFTHLIQSDEEGKDDEGTLNQTVLPAHTKLSWVSNKEKK